MAFNTMSAWKRLHHLDKVFDKPKKHSMHTSTTHTAEHQTHSSLSPSALSVPTASISNTDDHAIFSNPAMPPIDTPSTQPKRQRHQPPHHHQTSPFFTLPAELRNRIYQLINNPATTHGPSPSSPAKNHPVPIDRLFTQPGYKLTQISTQIRAESSPVFFACNTFKFYLCFPPPAWISRVEAKYLAFVSFVVLEDYQSEGWHPTPVCQSRIEIDLAKGSVVKQTDRKCAQCERRRFVRTAKLEEIVRGMRETGGGGSEGGDGEEKQSPKLTREGLLAMFDAARFNYGEESRLAGIEERVID